MKFFDFNQNNSGGRFYTNDKLCHRVVIEAENADEANRKAEELGCYWNGCSTGQDCPCCGDRWSAQWSDDGLVFPIDYGKAGVFSKVEEYMQYLANEYGWTIPEVRIYYADGTVKEIFTEKKNG